MISRLSTVIVATMLVILAASLPANATILTFNNSDGVSSNASLPTYGDNVASGSQDTFTYYDGGEGYTNKVSLDFTSVAGTYQTYTDAVWTGTIYSDGRYITFTPSAGASVTINDLNLESYGSGSIDYLKVVTFDNTGFENGTLLSVVSSTTSVVSGPVGQLFSVNYTGAPGQVIGLTFGGSGSNVAIDSLRFSQQLAPEPASLAMLSLGGLLLLKRRSR